MKYIFLFLLSCISLQSFSQNYLPYYQIVSDAENEIVEGDFKQALSLYEQAFESVAKPFGKDYFNAALCAARIKNDQMALLCIEKLMEKGVKLKRIKRKSFRYLYKTPGWKKLKKKECKLAFNEELLAELEALEKKDQAIRKAKYGYPASDTISYVDRQNMIRFKEILNTYGYPDEKLIGLNYPQYYRPPHYILVRHHYQNQFGDLSEILYQSVVEGKLSPRVFAEWEDKKSNWEENRDTYGTVAIFVVEKKDVVPEITPGEIDRLNKNRHRLGLENWSAYQKKIAFQEEQDEFFFGIYEGKVILDGVSMSQLEGWIQ